MPLNRNLTLSLVLAACLLPAMPSLAAGADEPVKAIMDLATALWSDNPPEGKDYFDKEHIGLFSKDFIALYREAEKYPAYDEGGGPFGYDVVTNSQEGCPLKDIAIAPEAGTAGTTDVKVTFKLMACYDGDPGKDALSEIHFKVVTEDGKSVISDMDRIIDGKPASLVAEMKNIIKAAQEAPAEQKEQQ